MSRWAMAAFVASAGGWLGGCGGPAPDAPYARTVIHQPSWVIHSDQVELAITELGGHMAPVTFYRGDRGDRGGDKGVQPYYVSPWQYEQPLALDDPVLVPLRGDFFCMPFGGNAEPYNGEKHPAHGEPAGSKWDFVGVQKAGGATTLTLSLRTHVRPGRIVKKISLVDGQNVVYVRHVLEGYTGKMPLGHHCTLAVPEKEGSLRVATSDIRFGMTCPVLFSDPAKAAYQSFAIGQKFQDLRHVPLLWKDPSEADGTRYPARTGFTDLLEVFSKPASELGGKPAWTAVTNTEAGYLWFTLKDPSVLPATVFWISNRGRHAAPWNGRNRCLGIEEVCGYFAEGLAASAQDNLLTQAGVPTAVELQASRPTAVNFIEGVVKVPPDFQTVQSIEFDPAGVTFISTSGKRVTAAVKYDFLRTGQL